MAKKKKVYRNKFRDILGDYYLSNREVTKQDKARYEEERQKGEKGEGYREKAMLIVIIALLVILVAKSLLFDEVKNLTPDEAVFKDFVEYTLEEDHAVQAPFCYRVVKIFMANPDEKALLRYEDPATGEMTEVVLEGRYTAQVRKYLLWVIPYKSISITSQIVE